MLRAKDPSSASGQVEPGALEMPLDTGVTMQYYFDSCRNIEVNTMQEMVKRFHALANKNRLAIYDYLREQEIACESCDEGCNVGDIAQQFDLALSTVSHHLKILHEAGLINCEQQGQFVYCTINKHTVEALQSFFARMQSNQPE